MVTVHREAVRDLVRSLSTTVILIDINDCRGVLSIGDTGSCLWCILLSHANPSNEDGFS
jgi:hypothetical protein